MIGNLRYDDEMWTVSFLDKWKSPTLGVTHLYDKQIPFVVTLPVYYNSNMILLEQDNVEFDILYSNNGTFAILKSNKTI